LSRSNTTKKTPKILRNIKKTQCAIVNLLYTTRLQILLCKKRQFRFDITVQFLSYSGRCYREKRTNPRNNGSRRFLRRLITQTYNILENTFVEMELNNKLLTLLISYEKKLFVLNEQYNNLVESIKNESKELQELQEKYPLIDRYSLTKIIDKRFDMMCRHWCIVERDIRLPIEVINNSLFGENNFFCSTEEEFYSSLNLKILRLRQSVLLYSINLSQFDDSKKNEKATDYFLSWNMCDEVLSFL